MPHQKPLIDLDKLDRNRGEQLKAIDGLAARLQPGIARDGSPVSVQTLIGLMRVFDSVCSPQRPVNWLGIAHWSQMAGISVEQCSRAISVLKSLDLITAQVTWVAVGKRGMKVAINWSTIFTVGPITQAPEDITAWTAKKIRQRKLFSKKRTPRTPDVLTVSETVTVTVSETVRVTDSETGVVTVSSIRDPQTYPLNQSAGGEGVDEGSFQLSAVNHQQENDDVTTGTGDPRATHRPNVQVRNASTTGHEGTGPDDSQQRGPHDGWTGHNAQAPRNEVHSRANPVPPADLIQTLVALNVADARAAVKKSLTAGYNLDQIQAIVRWYQAEALTDEHGKLVYPYDPGQLVLRLRDRDAIAADPAQGNWQGGKSGFWTRLAPISTPYPRKPARERPATPKPDRILVPTTYTTPWTRQQIEQELRNRHSTAAILQSLDRWHEGGPLPKTLAFWMLGHRLPVDRQEEHAR